VRKVARPHGRVRRPAAGVSTEIDAHDDLILIHHSLTVTTWGERNVGDRVNLEIDTMARYAARLVEAAKEGL